MNNEEQRKHAAEIGRRLVEAFRNLHADLEICEAATPGPWEVRDTDSDYLPVYVVAPDEEVVIGEITTYDAELDARFIAAARTGWPIAIRRALDAEERQHTLEAEVMANWREIAELKAEAAEFSRTAEDVMEEYKKLEDLLYSIVLIPECPATIRAKIMTAIYEEDDE